MVVLLLNRLRFLAAVVTVLIAAGCATTINPQLVETQTHGKTIAVASALGSNLMLTWTGTTILNSEIGEVAVPAWGIDEQATKAASSALLATRRYAAVKILSGISRESNAMPKLPSDAQADFLLLIEPKEEEDAHYLRIGGLGIVQSSVFGLEGPTFAHVGVSAELFDLSSGKSLGSHGEFVRWLIPAKLKSGGGGNLKLNKLPEPTIDQRDLNELQQPITTRLVQVIDQLIGSMGLR